MANDIDLERSPKWHIAKNTDLNILVLDGLGVTIRHTPDNQWFSATDLFKASGKQMAKYLKADSTKTFYAKLAAHLGWQVEDLLTVVKGGNLEQGTWVNKRALMHVLAECSDEIKVWFFGEIGFDLLNGSDIKHSDAMSSLQNVGQNLSQSDPNLIQQYETQVTQLQQHIQELEALTDDLANDLALKDHQLNQMKYFVEEADVLGRWQQENSWQ